jgi:hypothetical protein
MHHPPLLPLPLLILHAEGCGETDEVGTNTETGTGSRRNR